MTSPIGSFLPTGIFESFGIRGRGRLPGFLSIPLNDASSFRGEIRPSNLTAFLPFRIFPATSPSVFRGEEKALTTGPVNAIGVRL